MRVLLFSKSLTGRLWELFHRDRDVTSPSEVAIYAWYPESPDNQ
jgi:hypothetical protein